MTDIPLRVVMQAIGAGAVSSAIGAIASALGSGGLTAALAATGVAAAGLAVGFGVTAVKAAGDFQSSLTTLVTGAGEAQSNLGLVSDGILKMAVDTGTSTKQLTDGMYMIESAGYHGAQGLSVLKAAAMGAKVGNADLGTVADATTTIMTDFSKQNVTASQAVNTLVATVSNGKTTMQALSSSLSQIMPTASAAGISLTDTSAAMATMTGEGVPAANAATYLRQTIIGLQAPSKGTITALKDVGLSSSDVADEMKKSLPNALKMITDAVGKKFPEGSAGYVNAIKNISGGSKTMQGMLDLTGSHMQTFIGNVGNITQAVKQGGNSISGWAQVQQNFNFKLSQGKEVLETLSIKIGQALLPVVTQLMGNVLPLITRFSDWLTQSNALQGAISGLSPVIGNVKNVLSSLSPFVATIGNVIHTIAVPAIQIFKQALSGAQSAAAPIIAALRGSLIPAIQNLIGVIAPVVAGILQWVANSGAVPAIMSAIGATTTVVVNVLSGLINGLASVVKFFTQTELGGALLKATLVTLGIVLGIIAAAVLPPLIAGLVAMGIAAVTTGIEMALAFAPVIIPILAIIAIVTAVILIVQHWGQIAHFIQQAWAAALNWIKGAFGSLGAFFTGVWHGIQNAFGNVGQWFQDRFKQAQQGMKSGWDNVTGFIHGVGQNIGNTFQGAANNVVKAHQWMMAHNYYYHDAVTAIQNWTNNAKNFITDQWNNVKNGVANAWNSIKNAFNTAISFLGGLVKAFWNTEVQGWTNIWNGIKSIVSSLWNDVTSAFSAAFNTIGSVASSFWNMEVQGWTNIWNSIVNIVHNLWSNVTSAFSTAWGSISGALQGLWSNISGWFSNLAGQALQWGANIINSLAQGIENAAGAVGNAASDVAGKIHDLLGFHSPAKEGPASDADKWMPNLINMLSHDLIMNSPQLGLAATVAAQALATPLATGFRADPYTRADQLSFSTPTMIYSGASKARETSAARKAEEERKKEDRKLAEEHKKEARKAAEAEKKHVHVVINEIKHEMHIHAPNSKLTKEQINEIVDQAMHQFGKKLADEIRSQFGNI